MINPLNAMRDFYETTLRPVQQDVTQTVQSVAEDVQQFIEPAKEVVADLGKAGERLVNDVGTAIQEEGVLNVAGDLLQHGAKVTTEVAGAGLNEIIQNVTNTDDGKSFADWLLGPEGPKVSDFTAQIPGFQKAWGNFMDDAMGNPVVAGAIGKAFGFEYNAEGDFYTTNESSMQSNFGFHAVYDKAGKFLGMDLDEKVMHFEANGTQYKLEFWKGGYGSGGAFGGEIGLYSNGSGDRGPFGNLLEKIPGYYSSVTGDNQIKMTQTIYNKQTGQEYFTNDAKGADGDDKKHYWNLAIRSDPGVNHEDIGQRGTLEIENKEMAEAMHASMMGQRKDTNGDGVYDLDVKPLERNADGKWVINYDWRGEH